MWGKEQDVVVRPEPKRKRRFFNKKWVFIAFIGILGSLFFFAYTGELTPLTGNVIGGQTPTDQNGNEILTGFSIQADMQTLTNPFHLKQQLKEILIEAKGENNKIFIGKENILDLSELPNININIQEFDGTLHFDGNKIIQLEGKVNKITINGIPTSSTQGSINIKLEQEINYNNLEIQEIQIKKYEYADKGTITFNEKISLNTNGETLTITEFKGNIKGTETLFSMKGRIQKAQIKEPYTFELE